MKIFTKAHLFSFALYFLVTAIAEAQIWVQVPTPNPGPDRNQIRGISGTASNDVWAVGRYMQNPWGSTPSINKNLAMHWDGLTWTVHQVPSPGLTFNMLLDVEAISSNNVWAVGQADAGGGNSQAHLLHWDGATWASTIVNFPTPGSPWPGSTALEAIDAISANDIWAVGFKTVPHIDSALAYHYNGTSWSSVPVPAVGQRHNNLRDVDGIAANDVWAVGSYRVSSTGGQFKPMALHWNGTSWTNIPLPASLNNQIAELEYVRMVSSNDVWASGTILTGGVLLLHWDGVSWSQMSGPVGGADFAVLSSNNIYSVGAHISHWNGSNWTIVDSLKTLTYPSLLSATVLPNGEIWAGGISRDMGMNGDDYTLVKRFGPGLLPRLSVSSSAPVTPSGSTVQLNAQPATPGTYTYRWTSSVNNAFSNPNIANPTVTPTAKTTYSVNVTDQNGNSMQGTVQVRIGNTTAITSEISPGEISVSPNPFHDKFGLTLYVIKADEARLSLTDALGRTIYRNTLVLQAGKNQVPIKPVNEIVPKGVYLLTIRTGDTFRKFKLLKE